MHIPGLMPLALPCFLQQLFALITSFRMHWFWACAVTPLRLDQAMLYSASTSTLMGITFGQRSSLQQRVERGIQISHSASFYFCPTTQGSYPEHGPVDDSKTFVSHNRPEHPFLNIYARHRHIHQRLENTGFSPNMFLELARHIQRHMWRRTRLRLFPSF